MFVCLCEASAIFCVVFIHLSAVPFHPLSIPAPALLFLVSLSGYMMDDNTGAHVSLIISFRVIPRRYCHRCYISTYILHGRWTERYCCDGNEWKPPFHSLGC